MRRLLLVSLFIISSASLFAGADPPYPAVGLEVCWGGYNHYMTAVIETGKKFGSSSAESNLFGHSIITYHHNQFLLAAAEFNFRKKDFIVGPKLIYEYTFEYVAIRSEFTWFTDFRKSDPRFSPGVGVALRGWIGVYYMYQLPLIRNPFEKIARNKLSVTLRLPLI